MLTLNRHEWELKNFLAASKKAAASPWNSCPKSGWPCPESGFKLTASGLNLKIKKICPAEFLRRTKRLAIGFSNALWHKQCFSFISSFAI
jgi:hypothetical protein